MRSHLAILVPVLGLVCLDPSMARSQSSSSQLQEVVDRRQARSGSQRTLEEHLTRLVERDPAFDSGFDLRTGGQAKRNEIAPYMRAVYGGLHYLLSDELRVQFLGLSSDSLRGDWMRRYWVLRDPTPTTVKNERLEEHRNRVRLAREHFSVPGWPGWDDRGAFLILYGPPQGQSVRPGEVTQVSGFSPTVKYWFYDDGVVVPFEQRLPGGPWEFGISAQKLSSRIDFVRDVAFINWDLRTHYRPSPMMYDETRPQAWHINPDNAAAIALSQAAASELLESRRDRLVLAGPPRPRLWFVFDTDAFASPAASTVTSTNPASRHERKAELRTRVEAHVQFSLADLEFQAKEARFLARIGVEGVLLDEELREAARDTYEEKLTAQDFEATRMARLIPGQLNFDVPPGTYRLAIRVADLTSTAEGSYTTDVVVPLLPASQLRLSDIELATMIVEPSAAPARFEKSGSAVVPNPIGAYQNSGELTAYFEIYGLQVDDDASSRYQISYQIVSHQRRRHQGWFPKRGTVPVANVTSSFAASASTADPVEKLRIDISSLDQATYDLVVTVQDLIGSSEATTSTSFSVVRN